MEELKDFKEITSYYYDEFLKLGDVIDSCGTRFEHKMQRRIGKMIFKAIKQLDQKVVQAVVSDIALKTKETSTVRS